MYFYMSYLLKSRCKIHFLVTAVLTQPKHIEMLLSSLKQFLSICSKRKWDLNLKNYSSLEMSFDDVIIFLIFLTGKEFEINRAIYLMLVWGFIHYWYILFIRMWTNCSMIYVSYLNSPKISPLLLGNSYDSVFTDQLLVF